MKGGIVVGLLAVGTVDLVWLNVALFPAAMAGSAATAVVAPAPSIVAAALSPTAAAVAPTRVAATDRSAHVPRRRVNSDGHPEPAAPAVTTAAPTSAPALAASFGTVAFPTGGTRISADGQRLLARLAILAASDPTLRIELRGHTDRRGRPSLNGRLSRKRARAAQASLITLGVERARVRATGAGASEPVAQGAGANAYAANRRVEINLLHVPGAGPS